MLLFLKDLKTGFSSLQIILLMILKCDEFMSYGQVSKDLATFGEALDILLQPLFDKSFIQQKNHDGKIGIELLHKGEGFLAQIWLLQEKSEQEILAHFSEEEKTLFNDFLLRIQKNCQNLIDAEK